MPITCPACSKQNDAQSIGQCARCGCDLSMLSRIQAAAQSHLALARSEFENGDWLAALAQAGRSWELVHSTESAQAACLASAALGDSESLAIWRGRTRVN